MAFAISCIYVLVNTLQNKYDEAIIAFIPVTYTLFCYWIYRKGYVVTSKLINLHFTILVIGILCLKTSPVTGVMAFFIPIFTATQITFQGKERKYAYILNGTTFILMLAIFWADTAIHKGRVPLADDLRTEWYLNYSGAAIATVIQIVFLINVSNRLQSELINKETERKQLEQQMLEQAINQQKLITEVTLQVQEKEKTELGAELHDNINQILAAARMYLDIYISKMTVADTSIQKSHDHLEKALYEIRKLSHSLVTPSLEEKKDLFDAIKELVTDQTTESHIKVIWNNQLNPEHTIPETRKIVCYRVVQEQMSNILKYANASVITITLRSEAERLYLSIQDNGKGFDTNQKTKGIGFKNIKNRVQLYSGDMKIVSTPGGGCLLEVYISSN